MTSAAPWDLAGKGEAHESQLHQVVYLGAESIRIAGILLQPFIPEKANEILDRLGVDPGARKLEHAKLHIDATYGTSRVPLGEGAASSVFPPIPWEH